MLALKKLSESFSESTDPRVISELFYERNTPQIHKDAIEALLRRFINEENLIERWNNHASDACNLECTDYEEMLKRFLDWLKTDQLEFLI